MPEHKPIPEPLRGFMSTYLNPELYGRFWKETLESYFDADPVRAATIRQQFEEAVGKRSITPDEFSSVTGDRTGTQEDLDKWLEILRHRMFDPA